MSHVQPNGAQQPPVANEHPKKKNSIAKKAGIGCLGLILLVGGCSAIVGQGAKNTAQAPATSTASAPASASQASSAPAVAAPASSTPATEEKKPDTIKLEATATGNGQVIWGTAGSTNTEQFSGTWVKEVPKGKELMTLMVSGDGMDPNSKVTCKLYINGELKQEKSGSGQFGSASCTQPLF